MARSTLSEEKKFINMKARRLFTLFLVTILSVVASFAQPAWFPGPPTIAPVGALSAQFNFGLTGAGTVYVIIYNSAVLGPIAPATVKAQALLGPSGGKVVATSIVVTAGQINTALSQIFTLFDVNRPHALFCVAQNNLGVIQAVSVRIGFTTLTCPPISFLNQLQQFIVCVNKGAVANFNLVLDANSGILKGTTWFIDWGDGTTSNYISTADANPPPAAMRTHTYSSITTCNYVFTCAVKNPCGQTYSPQYVAVVHGRDINTDGDGNLRLVNNANGSSLIQVCAGTQTTITIRDNSIWNCKNPVVPGGLTAVPNLDPRNIEWLYGRDQGGAITNTITGAVDIATIGIAPRASGRF